MGMGATNTLERIAASIGQLNGVEPKFSHCLDVPTAGVLFCLPALLVSGLLSQGEKYFQLPPGYYRLDSIFLLLALMSLARIKNVEDLRYSPPGEWGKMLGLDRIPEAKTLREKIGILSSNDSPSQWASELSKEWMQGVPEAASTLYIDGHVRVYNGNKTKLPKHYVSRQKLCLRATVDYWVNAMDGQPFFLLNKEVDPGLLKVLEEEIVPILEQEVPNQPSEEELEQNREKHRFTLIFDREGYSPEFFMRMKEKRIACLSYNKYAGEDWSDDEFSPHKVIFSSGNEVEMELAERGTFIGKKLWVREIRRMTKSGHQTSILSTDYVSDLKVIAVAMFSRWCQENYFKYMLQHYNLDGLVEYATEEVAETTKVVNPAYRKIDSEVRKKVAILTRKHVKLSESITGEIEPKKMEKHLQQRGELQEEISSLKSEIELLKEKRKLTEKHITVAELPKDEQFRRLSTQSKYLIDTIKMIAYRAETSMANLLREKMSHPNEARTLLRAIYNTDADILPDYDKETLTIRLHQIANRISGKSIRYLCDELNATETVFPGTNLRMIYELVT